MDLVEREGELYVGQTRIADLIERLGTPVAIYDADAIIERFYRFVEAFSPLRAMICFATDACPNAHIMHRLVKRGAALCVHSATDLERAWICGAPISRVVYSGLGKTDMDIRAALDGLYSPLFQAGRLVDGKPPYYRGPVGYFSVKSAPELDRIARIAGGVRITCRILLHVCFDCCRERAFGLSGEEAVELFSRCSADPRIRVAGLRVHIGPGGGSADNMAAAVEQLDALAQELADRGLEVGVLDIGGGFACDAFDPDAPSPEAYARALQPVLLPWVERGVKIIAEPGWSIVGAASLLIARVLATRACEGTTLGACDALPGEPRERAHLHAYAVSGGSRREHASTLHHVQMPHRQVEVDLACRADEVIAFPGGGAYARRDNADLCEVLLEHGRIFVIRPRPTATDVLEPELESREVLL